MPNLLPEKEKKMLHSLYRSRLIVTGLLILTALSIIASVLLFPSYLLVVSKLNAAEESLEVLKESVSYRESRNIEQQISESRNYLAALSSVVRGKSGERYLVEILNTAPLGVEITSITFRKLNHTSSEISLSGKVSTRERLISFSEDLKANPNFSSVDLPLSNLAKDKDITFSMTISITNQQ